MFYSNVTSLSKLAKEHIGGISSQYQMIGLNETHNQEHQGRSEKKWWDKMGFKTSMAPAMRTEKTVTGTSGGLSLAMTKKMTSYSAQVLENNPKLLRERSKRYWVARYLRWTQRNLLVIVVYLPPGEDHGTDRQETLEELGETIKAHKGAYLVVGDWNQEVQGLVESGFPNFVKGTVINPKEKTCTQGGGTEIDYCLVSAELAESVQVKVKEGKVPWGPHLGIEVYIDASYFENTFLEWLPIQELPKDKGAHNTGGGAKSTLGRPHREGCRSSRRCLRNTTKRTSAATTRDSPREPRDTSSTPQGKEKARKATWGGEE